MALVAAVAAVSGGVTPTGVAAPYLAQRHVARSVGRAYRFLDSMLDRRTSTSAPRLVQSFTGGRLERQHFTDSETYDDDVVIDAYVARGGEAALGKARVIGNGLRFVQRHDPAGDGRVRAAYAPTVLRSAAAMHITDRTSDVGNMAWVGLAWLRLAAATHNRRYLRSARQVGVWVEKHCRDTRGAGGFTGGYRADGKKIKWKSTEHNVDLYAMYRMLAAQTGTDRFSRDAAWARTFVKAMWRSRAGDFYVGTGNNGVTPNAEEQSEDVNSWTYLALRNRAYQSSVDWDVKHLSVSGSGYAGVSFCAGDRSGAWYEGTAHLADALQLRGRRADVARAAKYLSDIRQAQRSAAHSDGRGVIAASKNRLSDCDGDFYYSSLHIGATAWYILAALKVNPFR